MIGLIGKKVGMTQVFDEQGILTPVTVIKIEPNTVVSERTREKCGYDAVVLGAEDVKENRLSKPYRGQFKGEISPKRYLVEIADFDKDCAAGDLMGVDVFDGCRYVDVRAKSKGKGFQGVMKRYGFSGGRATHGSKFHRAPGSTGQNTYPGHVFKNAKMPGRMGGEKVTVQNLELVRIDKEKQVLLVKGAVPGARNGMVLVTYSRKKEM
ncbi:MAG: 50S ribosomal protein L3 [Spirochaetales bacterium]|jgi:large subunit ribosomal protein L3|nr:50S ribosomal protein L3 [Spirochaetales bacterium]